MLYIQVVCAADCTVGINLVSEPRYQAIKQHLLDQIESGTLTPGTRVASENRLSEQFSVSRMTARRALEELSDAGFLFRSQGLGTFVADARPMSSMVEIRNIADEIRERGHRFAVRQLRSEACAATDAQAQWLGLKSPAEVFRSTLVFLENEQPIQLEDRLVNPDLAPEYRQQDFSRMTPHEYLSLVAPLTEADHIIDAILPAESGIADLPRHLCVDLTTPCLRVSRRTYSSRGIVSVATLVHPGNRYRLGGHLNFNPKSSL